MGISLERKTLLSCRSERVKAVDFHPSEPWVLSALYNGTVTIRNYQTNVLVKTIEVCELPVRTVKFIARKNWIIVGSDDLTIRVFNYNTLERVIQFTAHSDYIRGFAVHPTRSIVLSCSDDLSIKAWDWDKSWKSVAIFEGHSHYVMGIVINPKDSNTFASVSLDKTIKIWSLSSCVSSGASSSSNNSSSGPVSVKANYSMGEGGHEKGINCVDFYGGSDRPFLVTGSDDFTVRVWDYHTKSCVRVLEGHTNNVSAVMFHPQLPFLLSAGEDTTLRIWNAQTFRPEASYNFGMERAWGLACCRAYNAIGLAFDSGSVVFQLGRGDPCASLDPIQGRLVWSRARGSGASSGSHGNEILTGMVRLLDVEGRSVRIPGDGEVIPLTPKELGSSDVFPQNLQHSPDGRLVAVWGDGEYVVYSTIGWRNRSFGRGAEIAWAAPGGDVFASRDAIGGRVSINRVTSHDGSSPIPGITDCDRIFGGPLLGISRGGSSLSFYDWSGSNVLIRTIDVCALSVSWSLDGSHVAILTEDSCYVLSVNGEVLASPQSFESGEEGIEDSLELADELEQVLRSVCWISGDCFVYLTQENRLAYHVVGGDADESFQLAVFDKSHFMLGFLPSEGRVYLTDQDLQVTSYAILPALIAFQSAVLKDSERIEKALLHLTEIPSIYHARLAVFLQRRGHLREALKISPDATFQFNLALQLGDLSVARDLLDSKLPQESEKWQELGGAALKAWHLPIAEEALRRSGDLSSLFLLYAAAGDVDGLLLVAREASCKPESVNLAFAAYVKAGAYRPAFDLLIASNRGPEAALFARTYGLSEKETSEAVEFWRKSLKKGKASEALADPSSNPDLFSNVQFNEDSAEAYSFAIPVVSSASGTSVPRGRSVSFDGNVSVAGSTSTMSLKANGEDAVDPAAFKSSIEEDSFITTTTSGTDKYSTTATIGSDFTDLSSAAGSLLSDDQMSLEVNTAGTGTRLEDLDEEEDFVPGIGGIVEEEQLGIMDDLSDEPNNENIHEHVPEDINENISEIEQIHEQFTEDMPVTEDMPLTENMHITEDMHISEDIHITEDIPIDLPTVDISTGHLPSEYLPTEAEDIFGDEAVFTQAQESFPIEQENESDLLASQLEEFNVCDEPFGTLKVVEQGADIYDVREGEYNEIDEHEESSYDNYTAYDASGSYNNNYNDYTTTATDTTADSHGYYYENSVPIAGAIDEEFDVYAQDSLSKQFSNDEKEDDKTSDIEDSEDATNNVHEEIDFGGDGEDVKGWL